LSKSGLLVKVNNTVRTVARDIFELKLLLMKSEKSLNVASGNGSSSAAAATGQNPANIKSTNKVMDIFARRSNNKLYNY
jgi:hypothetical protein